jgi:hypothetical protein
MELVCTTVIREEIAMIPMDFVHVMIHIMEQDAITKDVNSSSLFYGNVPQGLVMITVPLIMVCVRKKSVLAKD